MKTLIGIVLAASLLSGCAATWGFAGQVGEAPVDGSGAVTPIRGVTVTCDTCTAPVEIQADGSFGVGFGTSSEPPRAVLRFGAPGYEPLELRVDKSPMVGQAGPVSVLVLLRRKQPTGATSGL